MNRRIAKKIVTGLANEQARWNFGQIERAMFRKPDVPPKTAIQAARQHTYLVEQKIGWRETVLVNVLLDFAEVALTGASPLLAGMEADND
jgi:hypothetical protein